MDGIPELQHQNRIVPNRRNRDATKIEPLHNTDERTIETFLSSSLKDNAITALMRMLQFEA